VEGVILIKKYIVFSVAHCVLGLLLVAFVTRAVAGDFLLFPSATFSHQSKADVEKAEPAFLPSVDFFYSNEYQQTRFLAEFVGSSEETDLERMQFGWHILPGKSLWVGRFHSPISFWNTQMHHGDFLQTSLSRPTVANYEDDLGPLPTHIAGVLFESSSTVGDSEINYSAGLGIGPTFDLTKQKLEPFDLLNPSGSGKYAGSVRLGYHPEVGNPNQFGVAVGYARIPVLSTAIEVRQSVLSAFLNFERDRLHLISEMFAFNNQVYNAGNHKRYSTVSAYVQPEYKLGESGRTTAYVRVESTPNAAKDGYLGMIPEFSPHQTFAGFRFDITPTQAIKIEAGDIHRQDSLEFQSINAQWSMVLAP
jgi:hypothetical protein